MDDLLNLEWPQSGTTIQPTKPVVDSPLSNMATLSRLNATTKQPQQMNTNSINTQLPKLGLLGISTSGSSQVGMTTSTSSLNPRLGQMPISTSVNPKLKNTKTATSGNDSFAGLLSIGDSGASSSASSKAGSKLSLQERQKMMQEEKRKAMEQQSNAFAGIADGLFDNTFGSSSKTNTGSQSTGLSGMSTLGIPPDSSSRSGMGTRRTSEDLDDILAAFDSSAPVDASSHLPPPSNVASHKLKNNNLGSGVISDFSDLDLSRSNSHHSNTDRSDTDDFINFPSFKPAVSERAPRPKARSRVDSPDGFVHVESPATPAKVDEWVSQPKSSDPRDRAVAELVDMGFEVSVASEALEQTPSGCDVHAAVGIILNQVHQETKSRSKSTQDQSSIRSKGPSRGDPSNDDYSWAFPSQKATGQIASELGTNLMKSANSLWRVGQKHLKQAVADFQVPSNSEQPRWMTEVGRRGPPLPVVEKKKDHGDLGLTDEALMLEIQNDLGPSRRPKDNNPFFASDAQERSTPKAPTKPIEQYKQKITRADVERESTAVYTSSARRRPVAKTTPDVPPRAETTGSLFDINDRVPDKRVGPNVAPRSKPVTTHRHSPSSRPAVQAPQRIIPDISSQLLSQSTAYRSAGNEAFKNGNFDAAYTLFGKSLTNVPSEHPVRIVIYCNRAATALKIGDAKGGISDADAALRIIGSEGGKNEEIELIDEVSKQLTKKDMREYFGRALHRKAQGLEQMERWVEAGDVWQQAIEAGVGGSIGMTGRSRCLQTAAAKKNESKPKPKPRDIPKPATATRPVQTADEITAISAAAGAAIEQHRKAGRQAAELEEEKFQIQDVVDERICTWAGKPGQGRGENLRALLASLDKVLWENSGWKMVGMSGLVLPNKVKIAYMKALTVVHPDKLPPTATAEQQLLAGYVFTILNSAWDKFKGENGM